MAVHKKMQSKQKIFDELKKLISRHAPLLVCVQDTVDAYHLYTKYQMKNGQPLYFGGIKINKSFVSYYLMPIYVNPEMLKDIDANLKKHLKGKSCFNFKQLDDDVLTQLQELTDKGLQDYHRQGYLV